MTEDQLKRYLKYLQSHGYTAEIENGNIKVSVTIENINVILKCALSRFFPYEIPQIFISEESKKALPKMPHFHTDGSICIFDEGKVIPNINHPESLILYTISSAISIIEDGIQGKNKHDFIDEFLEYWSTKGLLNAQTYIERINIAQSIQWCFKDEDIIIAESRKRLKEIYYAISGKNIGKCNKGLFIPIEGSIIEDIPKTDIDIVKIIEKYSSYKIQYNSFMQKNIENPSLVILNIVMPEGNMIVGWLHPGIDIPKGFRKGHVNLKIAFSMTKDKGIAVSVENCHQNRLFTRGGDGKKDIWNKTAIIGCGSVGSFIVDALKYYGTEEFILVDNEVLQYENIARHTAGYLGVGISKVKALDFLLAKHNPNIICETYKENAHAVIEDRTDVINSCEIIFVAVASVPVEHHINHLMLEGRITKPIVIIWVEPYLVGGHALVIKKKQDLYKEIFEQYSFEYKYNIVQNGCSYLKREAGCQSTYMPYSGFMLQQFVCRMLDHILSNCWNQRGNYALTWCGKLTEAKKQGMRINKEYENVEDYSMITRRID